MALSSPLTVVGMVNGMIGGLILILPVDALNAGYAFTFIVIVITGAFSYYSCYLCVKHLGNQPDLDYSMFKHFNKSACIRILYDATVFSNLLFIGLLYFQLITVQWEGILNSKSIIIPLVNTVILFALILLLKYFDFGAKVMAYGIVSIVAYLLFLIWVTASAPSGSAKWIAFGQGEVSLAAAMGMAFAIQTFFIPILRKNPKENQYSFFTLLAYILGGAAYMYIAFMGAFGILNRTPQIQDPQDIQNYFPAGQWEVSLIESIYLVHLYSVFPEFTLISKKRLFSIFKLRQSVKGEFPIPEIIYSIIFVVICLVIRLVGVQINDIVNLNGSVIGFFFIYLLPALLHIRCLYFSKNKLNSEQYNLILQKTTIRPQDKTQKRITNVEMSFSQSDAYKNKINKSNTTPLLKQQQKVATNSQLSNIQGKNINPDEYFMCNCIPSSILALRILQMVVLVLMMLLGAFIMVNGIISVFG